MMLYSPFLGYDLVMNAGATAQRRRSVSGGNSGGAPRHLVHLDEALEIALDLRNF